MSYQIVVTYTKSAETPENAFKTIPVLKPDENVTQEQITALQTAYPYQFESRIIQDQLIMSFTYNSEEDYNSLSNDSTIKDLQARRRAWAELNKVTFDLRVL
jgi:hypothetical protein